MGDSGIDLGLYTLNLLCRGVASLVDESVLAQHIVGNIHGVEKIAVMAALNITHDMLRKNRLINETRHATAQQVQGIEAKIDSAIAQSRQLEI